MALLQDTEWITGISSEVQRRTSAFSDLEQRTLSTQRRKIGRVEEEVLRPGGGGGGGSVE